MVSYLLLCVPRCVGRDSMKRILNDLVDRARTFEYQTFLKDQFVATFAFPNSITSTYGQPASW